MKRKNRVLLGGAALAFALLLVVVVVALAASVTVDTFNEATQDLQADPDIPTQSGTADDLGILGGERDVELNWISGQGAARTRIDKFGTNAFIFSAESGVSAVAIATWDGDDNSATTLTPAGLGGVDLTDIGSNDGFRIQVTNADLDTAITITAYTDASNWSEYSFDVPGGIVSGNSVDFFALFNSFGIGAGTGVDFTDAGAVVLTVDGKISPGTDITLDLMEASGERDFGDLPSSYPVANHIPLGLRMGSNVDVETATITSTGAVGDNNDQSPDDEDGVSPTPGVNWVAGGGGSVSVIVKGCEGTCKVSGWVDWTQDGDFADPFERILDDRSVGNGTRTLPFSIPGTANTTDTSLYTRFRICEADGECDTPDATNVLNGEVEDYLWAFGPTAVTLTDLSAQVTDSRTALPLLAVSLLLVAGLLLAARAGFFRRQA